MMNSGSLGNSNISRAPSIRSARKLGIVTKMKKLIILALIAINVGGCGGSDCSGPQCTVLHFEALYTTAPAAISITTGETRDYNIGGGTQPYNATSSDPKILTSLVDGYALKIGGISGGQAKVAIVDKAGKRITLDVTVAEKGLQTVPPPTIFPASITIGDCTTNVPFTFTGGMSPFTIYTSDNFNVPVSAAQPLGSDNFFTATVKALAPGYPNATLTVLDSQSRTAIATIIPGSAHASACPTNPLLQTFPASSNARVTEKISFQISGGFAPYKITAVNQPSAILYTQNIATPVTAEARLNPSDQKYYFEVVANSTGNSATSATGASLITVTSSDGQKANIVFTVFPLQ